MTEIADTENQWGIGMNWAAFERAQAKVMARSDFSNNSHNPMFLSRALAEEYIFADRQVECCEVEPMWLVTTIRAMADVQDVMRADSWPLPSAEMRAPLEHPSMTLDMPPDWHSIFRIIGDNIFDYRIRFERSRNFLLARDQNFQVFRSESHYRRSTKRLDGAGKTIDDESSISIVSEGFRMPSGKDRVVNTLTTGDTIESSYCLEGAPTGKRGTESTAGNEVAVANCIAIAMNTLGLDIKSVENEASTDHHVDAWLVQADGQRIGVQVTTPESEQMFKNASHGESSGKYSESLIVDLIKRAMARKKFGGDSNTHLALDCSYGFPALESVVDIMEKQLPISDSPYVGVWIVNTGTRKAHSIYPRP